MSEEVKKEEQSIVDEHRKMVIMTGNLSDFQLENLKNWAFLIFDKEVLVNAKITYDFTKLVAEEESLSPGAVQYDFYFKPGTKLNRADVKKRIEHLRMWVKFMFWKETEVRILKEGKKWQI
ncbi:MAG TPA: hypothetical protein DDY18_07375 [Flavobacterium sp.]|nr:hypothetical protein [Flavobacterium sp.]